MGLLDQAEVEDHHPPRAADEHVGGLEIAVEHAVAVQRRDPLGELAEQRSQASGVGEGPLAQARRGTIRGERCRDRHRQLLDVDTTRLHLRRAPLRRSDGRHVAGRRAGGACR